MTGDQFACSPANFDDEDEDDDGARRDAFGADPSVPVPLLDGASCFAFPARFPCFSPPLLLAFNALCIYISMAAL